MEVDLEYSWRFSSRIAGNIARLSSPPRLWHDGKKRGLDDPLEMRYIAHGWPINALVNTSAGEKASR